MNRDKDKQLARAGHLFEARAMDALAWFNRNPQAAGTKTAEHTRRLRKLSLKAGKLARAASRPMSVAVFGASQAGKSFMTGQMISPAHRPTQVVFEAAGDLTRLDYGTRINPTGGKETTGLVTRFSIQPHEHPAPAGHPVVLKMLREVDVLKILANTHVFDCKAQWENNRRLDEGLVDALFARVGASLGTGEAPGMSISQIYELREYLETDLEDHPLAQARDDSRATAEAISLCEHYWSGIERLAPRANAQERCALFAPLWGELTEFSTLYLNLKDALDRLNHPEWGYVPLEAVLDRNYGVLHAETLYSMDPAHVATLEGAARNTTRMISIICATGSAPLSLPQPVITALTLELRLTLEHAPWDFFEHTDFLDFPGAKSRENKHLDDFLRHPDEKAARAHCFLRGKVAVLFDNYTADLEANALVLLEDNAQSSDVKTLPKLVERWVAKTHGDTPERRAQQPVSLFFVASKADTLFNIAGNQEGYGEAIRNRLDNNFRPYAAFLNKWAPGTAFDNVFFFRNPSFEQPKLVEYERDPVPGQPVPAEVRLKDAFAAELPAFKRDYLASPLVKAHVKDAETRLERMLTLNDGGVTLLAESLKPVCDPDLKYSQIVPPMQQVRTELETLTAPYFEDGDVERRVAERLAAIAPFCETMTKEPKQVGPFVRMLQTNDSTMKRCSEIFEKAHAARRTAYLAAEGATDDGLAASFGAQALADWRKHALAIAGDATLAGGFRVTPDALACAVREVIGAADRAGVDTRIDAIFSEIKATPRKSGEMAFRIGMRSAHILNDAVAALSDQAPPVPSAEPPPPWPNLPSDAQEIAARRNARSLRWLEALRQATELNARGGKGSVVTAEDNALLGDIIAAISAEDLE